MPWPTAQSRAPLASHLSASQEGPAWGPDPSLCRVLGCRDPSKGAGEAVSCCQGCCASSHPCCCLTVKVTRYKAAVRGKSRCSASLQHTGFPLFLSIVQESLNLYPEFPTGPLSLASGQLMGWRNRHAQPWLDLMLQCCSSGPVSHTKVMDVSLA